MIILDLKCDSNHQFEARFKSAAEFERQSHCQMIECPICASGNIDSIPRAENTLSPSLSVVSNQEYIMISAQFTQYSDKYKLH